MTVFKSVEFLFIRPFSSLSYYLTSFPFLVSAKLLKLFIFQKLFPYSCPICSYKITGIYVIYPSLLKNKFKEELKWFHRDLRWPLVLKNGTLIKVFILCICAFGPSMAACLLLLLFTLGPCYYS